MQRIIKEIRSWCTDISKMVKSQNQMVAKRSKLTDNGWSSKLTDTELLIRLARIS
jgi:hypothetical protein